jgi:hypothetical protein
MLFKHILNFFISNFIICFIQFLTLVELDQHFKSICHFKFYISKCIDIYVYYLMPNTYIHIYIHNLTIINYANNNSALGLE